MTRESKLNNIKILLGISDTSQDAIIGAYLDIAKQEILSWLYLAKGRIPETVTDVPAAYEPTQISAVVAGYSHSGAEGETTHNENGVNRKFEYDDMIAYIRSHVFPYAGV